MLFQMLFEPGILYGFRMAEIEKKRADQKAESEELANQKKQLKVKFDVLSNIHAKRDVKVRQNLGK